MGITTHFGSMQKQTIIQIIPIMISSPPKAKAM